MKSHVYCATLFALYQFTIALGIAMLPLAIAARQAGFTIPIHRLLIQLGDAYDEARVAME